MKKYYVAIKTTPNSKYQALGNWDSIYATRAEAAEAAARAADLWQGARVEEVDAPAAVDHLYFRLAEPTEDTTSLYDRHGNLRGEG